MKINIFKACSDYGISINGAKLGPTVLTKKLNNKKIKKIITIKNKFNYKKETEKNNNSKNLKIVNKFNKKLYKEVYKSIKNNIFPLIIGGDHSISIGSALASIKKYKNLGIIWFDTHGDFNTFETSPSGNIHGLPFAAVTGYEKKLLADFHKGNLFNFKNAVLFGAHDIDEPYELNNFKDAGVTIISTDDIKKYGIDAMCEKAFKIASNGTNGIHISYDLDCIDSEIVPGVSTPVPGGINLEEANYFIDYAIKNKEKIKSFDLVEFNPLNDINKKTEKIATSILNKIITNL